MYPTDTASESRIEQMRVLREARDYIRDACHAFSTGETVLNADHINAQLVVTQERLRESTAAQGIAEQRVALAEERLTRRASQLYGALPREEAHRISNDDKRSAFLAEHASEEVQALNTAKQVHSLVKLDKQLAELDYDMAKRQYHLYLGPQSPA